MPERIVTPQWRAANRNTHYPFAATATLAARDGGILVDGILIDAALYPVGGGVGLFLSTIEVSGQAITISVGNEGREQLCSGTFSMSLVPDLLVLADGNGRAAGVLVSENGQLATLQALGTGTHSFAPAATPFCASLCVPTPEVGVRGILLEDGRLMTGDVWLLGDDGVVLTVGETVLPGALETTSVIRLDVVGDPLSRRRLCGGTTLFTTPTFVQQLRLTGPGGEDFTVLPDSGGQIALLATSVDAPETVLRLTASAEGVEISAVGAASGL